MMVAIKIYAKESKNIFLIFIFIFIFLLSIYFTGPLAGFSDFLLLYSDQVKEVNLTHLDNLLWSFWGEFLKMIHITD